MSRSFKKSPVCTDGTPNATRLAKRRANHVIRKIDNSVFENNGTRQYFSKMTASYNIHDYKSRYTEEQAIVDGFYEWAKWYKRK